MFTVSRPKLAFCEVTQGEGHGKLVTYRPGTASCMILHPFNEELSLGIATVRVKDEGRLAVREVSL